MNNVVIANITHTLIVIPCNQLSKVINRKDTINAESLMKKISLVVGTPFSSHLNNQLAENGNCHMSRCQSTTKSMMKSVN